MGTQTKRPSTVAMNLLARPGAAPSRSSPVEEFPRPVPAPRPADAASSAPATSRGGIKTATIGTTVYLLPAEHKRVRRLALDLDLPSVHELLLIGLDRLLAEQSQPPLARYSPPRAKKG